MILCFDMGNTRTKWALYRDHLELELLEQGVLGKQVALSDFKSLNAYLSTKKLRPAEILLSSVSGRDKEQQFKVLLSDAFGLSVICAKTEKSFAGVTLHYKDVAKLGVDRWLALLGVRRLTQQACIIIDAGSAITVDALDANGHHQGGLIVPGLRLLERSLFSDTAQVKPQSLDIPQHWSVQQDTFPCVAHGISAMFKGFVSEVSRSVHHVYCTGGDGKRVQEVLSGDGGVAPTAGASVGEPPSVYYVPDLVTRGLLEFRHYLA